MPDGTQFSPEIVQLKKHPLEDRVIVHGFLGNIGKPEDMTISQIIQQGALVSPSKRALDPKEQTRLLDAPFDRDRVCFHTWEKNRENTGSYIGHAIWVAPVSAMEGTIIGDDIANETGNVFAFNRGGVEIPIDRGIIFISDNLLGTSSIKQSIELRAQSERVTPEDWIRRNVVLVPTEIFRRPNDLFRIISDRVQPAKGVSAGFVGREEINKNLRFNFVAYLRDKYIPATAQELGHATKIEGEPVTPEMMQKWEKDYLYCLQQFTELEEEMDENPLRLEELREPEYMYDTGWFFHQLKSRLQRFSPASELGLKVVELDKKRTELLQRCESILRKRYPNPISEEDLQKLGGLQLTKAGYGNFDTYVYLDNKGNLRVHKPAF